jgi:hypothetical protein
MSTSADFVHPQQLIDQVIELQRKLEDFKSNCRGNQIVLTEYESAAKNVTDAREAIMRLIAVFDHEFASPES